MYIYCAIAHFTDFTDRYIYILLFEFLPYVYVFVMSKGVIVIFIEMIETTWLDLWVLHELKEIHLTYNALPYEIAYEMIMIYF